MLADPRDAQSSSRFLIGGGHEHQGTGWRLTVLGAARDLAGDDGHRGGQVEHVDRAAPPHDASVDVGPEGRVRPAFLVDRDYVGVPNEGERARAAALIRATASSLDSIRAPGALHRHDQRGTAGVRGDAFD